MAGGGACQRGNQNDDRSSDLSNNCLLYTSDILPDFDKDATDRNRTSPFAFTGNKFEFRMVGSSDSIASANTVLNTIIAEAFKEAADKLEKADNFDMAVHDMIKETLAAHKRVVFNGNGYSDEWVAEAERLSLIHILIRHNTECDVDKMG